MMLERLQRAMNEHDLDALVACFAHDYLNETPAHPDHSFRGRDQVRKNWARLLNSVPDLHAVLVRSATTDQHVWAEWDWSGRQLSGAPFAMRGVTIFTLQHDTFSGVRFYMEPVQADGLDADAALAARTGARS
jgi:hypothetical protein